MTDETPTADEAARAAAAERAQGEARAAEIRENVAMTDARRAEEEVARAHAAGEKAAEQEEELSRKERRLREKAARVHAEADRMRAQADEASRAAAAERAPQTVSGGTVVSPGVGTRTEPDAAAAASGGFPGADRLPTAAQRPEVLAGAAFGGAFILARILKRIFD